MPYMSRAFLLFVPINFIFQNYSGGGELETDDFLLFW